MAIVFGAFSYGIIEQITRDMLNSTLSLGLFFLVGLGFLLLVSIPKDGLNTVAELCRKLFQVKKLA